MATGIEEVSGGWGIGRKRIDVRGTFPLAAILVLAASLLLSACASKDDPVIFGGAGGGNGGAGATSGVSVSF
jgi:hypothetical protein